MRRQKNLSTLPHILLTIWFWSLSAAATADDIEAQRNIINNGVLGILADGVRGTQIELIGDLATVIDDGYDMRILPIAGKGSVRAIEDLLLLRGVDLALVQADVLEFYKQANLFPDIDKKLRYIAKLHNEELHILARKNIRSIHELEGKKVNFGPLASGSYVTASLIFEQLRISPEIQGEDYQIGLERLRQGKIDAWVRVGAKPLLQMEELPAKTDVHFLSLPSSLIEDDYVAAELTPADYPQIISKNTTVETVAVGAVLAVFNWSSGSAKRRYLEEFSHRFVANFDRLQEASFHPKWREVDLNTDIPGWKRF